MRTFSIKSILAVSLVFVMSIMSSTAGAVDIQSTTVSGCSVFKHNLGLCTMFVEGLMVGLGNVDPNKRNGTPTAFTGTLSEMVGQAYCINWGGNSYVANGQPFTTTDVSTGGTDALDNKQVSKNGKALSDIVIHDAQIIQAIKDAHPGLIPDCQNSNWYPVVVLERVQAMGEVWQEPKTPNNCNLHPADGVSFDFDGCELLDRVRTSCLIEPQYQGDNLKLALGVKHYDYGDENTGTGDCTTICHSSDPTQCSLNPTPIPAWDYP